MARTLTNFDLMWRAYPNPGGSAEGAKEAIGGEVDADWIANTCVVRLSRCLNYAGHPIPERGAGFNTVVGGDGMHYGFRVRELRRYLNRTYAFPAITHEGDGNTAGVPAAFEGRKGVIAFSVAGWTDATGHVDLWNGNRPRHRAYFNKANKVELWEASDLAESPDRRAAGLPALRITGSVGEDGKNRTPDVVRIQVLLYENGLAGHLIDGRIGERTVASIRAFQARESIVVDGRVDPGGRTLRALNGS